MPSIGPNITAITDVRANSMKITWNTISEKEANGIITGYQVCYEASDTVTNLNCSMNKTVNNNATTTTTLENLYADTIYTVVVRAGTSVGFGNHGKIMRNTTLNGGKLHLLYFSFQDERVYYT